MAIDIRVRLNEGLYIKDPQETKLGQKIIRHSILLIDEIGFESFNFKKLAIRIQSTEASIYRYFENKHLLLIYLVSWYWEWVSYLITVNTMNIEDPCRKLKIVIETLVYASVDDPAIEYINESVLHRIVIAEGHKAYHTKAVDDENREGFFANYKSLTEKVASVVLEVKPDFPYSHALASTLFEMANNHIYFAQHLPRLTDVSVQGEDFHEVEEMLEYFAFSLLKVNGRSS